MRLANCNLAPGGEVPNPALCVLLRGRLIPLRAAALFKRGCLDGLESLDQYLPLWAKHNLSFLCGNHKALYMQQDEALAPISTAPENARFLPPILHPPSFRDF